MLREDVENIGGGNPMNFSPGDKIGGRVFLLGAEIVRDRSERFCVNLHAVADCVRAVVHLAVRQFVERVRAYHAQGDSVGVLRVSINEHNTLAVPCPILGGKAANGRERLAPCHVGKKRIGCPFPKMVFQKLRRFRVCCGHILGCRWLWNEREAVVTDDVCDE